MKKEKPTKFGRLLRSQREAAGMGVRELCRNAGLSSATVTLLETRPDANPSLETITKLASALQVGVHQLIP